MNACTMYTFIIYELKVAAVLAAFYLCFKCFLSREKMHRMNRVVLVASSILSFILPFCIITIHKTALMPETVLTDVLTATESDVTASTSPDAHSWVPFIVAAYWAGVLFVLGSIVLGILRVAKVIREGETKELYDTAVTVCKGDIPPFSWMRWIVMCELDFKSGNRHILEHEKAHIRLGHSKEVLLFDVMSALQWFNPAMWLLKRDLRAIHEYEADDAVLRGGADIKEYQYSLIRKAVSASGYSITNSFNHSILKNRITMMSKSKASRMGWLRALYVLPLVCGALALNAKTVTDCKISENSPSSKTYDSAIRIELKKDSEGEYRCFVMDGSVYYDDMFDVISSLISGDKDIKVEILAPADCRCGVIDDIKQGLREICALKVQYGISEENGPVSTVDTKTTEKFSAASDDTLEPIQGQPKENVHYVRINENDRVLFDTAPIKMEELENHVSRVVKGNHNYILCYQVNRGTSYGAYVTAQNEIMAAIKQVRNEYASAEFGNSFDALSDEQQKMVISEIPVTISEIAAKKSNK